MPCGAFISGEKPMLAISLNHIQLILGAHTIFSDLSFSIPAGEKIGLIGLNGAGKSSLFKLITGEYTYELGGSLVIARGITVGYLAQQPQVPEGQTAYETALNGRPRWAQVQIELERVETSLGDPQVYNDPKRLSRQIDSQQRLLDEFLALGGEGYPDKVRELLTGLGLKTSELDKPVAALSGGQKKLVGLAALLLAQPDVLLLDEPDNHLDLDGKAYLETLISGYPGAVVLVSHDRYLLDAVVTQIAELEDDQMTIFNGDYSSYVIDKELRLARQEELYRVQQREITRLKEVIKRFSIWAKVYDNEKFAMRARAVQKRLDKMDKIDKPITDRRRMGLELNGYRGSNKVLEMLHVRRSFDRQNVLRDVSTLIRHGERVGLIGANGAGKSVLLRLILGEDRPDSGEIILGPSVTLGYYAQEHETLDPEQSLMDAVRRGIRAGGSMSEPAAVSFLNRYLFPYRMVNEPIKVLSGGERSRLQLALLVLSGANFLLLDEPTNNLDIASAEVLENALEDFVGTVLVISHDRYFLDRTVQRLLELKDGVLHEYQGGYSDYMAAGSPQAIPSLPGSGNQSARSA
jgi:ATP-binding cassette, subfamily F, member 3